MTAVFDTNILFSATGWRGNPFHCVQQARSNRIIAVSCPQLMEELAEKLSLKLCFSTEQVNETLADYLSFLRLVNIPQILRTTVPDADDNAVSECALESQAIA